MGGHLHKPQIKLGDVEGAWPTRPLLLLKTGVVFWFRTGGLQGHPEAGRPEEQTKEGHNAHLGLSWHGVLGWSADLGAFALGGETGSFAQRVLHRHRGGHLLSNRCHQLQGGQRSRR